MKKTCYLMGVIIATLVMALSAVMLVGCQKEPDTPDTPGTPDIPDQPSDPNVFVPLECTGWMTYWETSYTYEHGYFGIASTYYRENTYYLNVMLNDGNSLRIGFSKFDGDSVTYTIHDDATYNDEGGCFVTFTEHFMGDDRYVFLSSGTVTFVKFGNSRYRIYGEGSMVSGVLLRFCFEGGIYSPEFPTGQGSLRVGSAAQGLNYVEEHCNESSHQYIFRDYNNRNELTITTKDELKEDIAISTNNTDMLSGASAIVEVKESQPNGGYQTVNISSGTLHVTRNNDRFTIALDDPSHSITASYDGFAVKVR